MDDVFDNQISEDVFYDDESTGNGSDDDDLVQTDVFKVDMELLMEFIVRMVCTVHNFPPRPLKNPFFLSFIWSLNPSVNFQLGDSQRIKQGCLEYYEEERIRIGWILRHRDGQINLTVETLRCYKSFKVYACVRAHFIDDNWNHKGWVLCFQNLDHCELIEAVQKCIKRWGIGDKVLTVIFQGYHYNFEDFDDLIKSYMQSHKQLELDGKLLHGYCCANLFKEMAGDAHGGIDAIILKLECFASFPMVRQYWSVTNSRLKRALDLKSMDEITREIVGDDDWLSDEEWKKVEQIHELVDKLFSAAKLTLDCKYPYGGTFLEEVLSGGHGLMVQGNYTSNGFLKVSCNGGLNQMRAAICDMVAVARLLNVTLVVPELDKKSFWADPSNFEDIFDVKHFIDSLRDEVRIIRRLPKKIARKHGYQTLVMPPVSWSNEKYYLEQILPLYRKYKVIHFNKTDTRLQNNGISIDIQKLRCRVNFEALKFTPDIEALGQKLVHLLQAKGPFLALHLRYEMDMLAFSGCTHGCTVDEAEELKRMRYAFPWWREKEIISEVKRSEGRCPLTPEEASLTLKALGFDKNTQIYIASGEIYGSERRLAALRTEFPKIVNKEMLLNPEDLKQFQNHSSQMAALDFIVSLASNTYVPTYDGNMARLVEGHRRYSGYKTTVQLDRKKLVELFDLHENGTLSWDEFSLSVRRAHEKRMGQPAPRIIIPDKPKEEDYFYANPAECLCQETTCNDDVLGANNSTLSR